MLARSRPPAAPHSKTGNGLLLGHALESLTFLVTAILTTAVCGSAHSSPTIYQMWNQNIGPEITPGLSRIGLRYYGGSRGQTDQQLIADFGPFAGPGPVNGRALTLIDSNEYHRRIKLLGYPAAEPAPAYGTVELRFPFVGSGIQVNQLVSPQGEDYAWQVVDSVANDSYRVVASGTTSTFSTGGLALAPPIDLVPAGTLPTNRMHILRIQPLDSDGKNRLQGGKYAMVIDSLGIYDDAAITFDDNTNLSGNWTFAGTWGERLDNDNYEGSGSYSGAAGDSVTVSFEGTAVAILGFGQTLGDKINPDGVAPTWGTGTSYSGAYSWQIDGGAGGSGIVDQSVDSHWSERWPELLVNGLPPGPHTLTITALGAFGELFGDYNRNGAVDGADVLLWQRSAGASGSLPRQNPEAATPDVVDEEDFQFWSSQFGNRSPARFTPSTGVTFVDAVLSYNPAATAASRSAPIPEPTTAIMFACVMHGMFARARKLRRDPGYFQPAYGGSPPKVKRRILISPRGHCRSLQRSSTVRRHPSSLAAHRSSAKLPSAPSQFLLPEMTEAPSAKLWLKLLRCGIRG